MRVFVAGTGRCGTCTFYQACRHLTNYTAGHESAAGGIAGPSYPDGHVEVSGQLVWEMALLRDKYPGAFWVHLVREREATAQSLAACCRRGVERWTHRWRQVAVSEKDLLTASRAYYDATNATIALLLPSRSLTVRLETAEEDWLAFWQAIGGEGDFEASLAEWRRRYNPREKRGRDRWA